jgi:hypothetical protein
MMKGQAEKGETMYTIPSNVRQAVLQGADIGEGFTTTEERFTGPNTSISRGEIEPDDTDFKIPFTARTTYQRPRRNGKIGSSVPKDARTAVSEGFEEYSDDSEDQFTGPITVIRTGEVESEDGLVIPFISKIKFGRPRRVPA